ncbi:YrdB family protein [Aeromicrobium terrae]|uniref:DUF2568 domain-containing protein n=1 Tax=Aeromicrobium terrae TaxID=2498846 RepID=A0A5C8NK70_9ACTN|nr:YrdB family protein [Aeromicrobium terrae]TXL61437.1 DUF2568 domain-containing protein [Aeromicrobium terrae]
MRVLNDIVALALEVAALVVLGWWGLAQGDGIFGVAYAVVAVGLFLLVWARWFAPKSEHRLNRSAITWGKLGMFALPVLALDVLDHPVLATVFAAVAVVHVALARAWDRI